MSTGDLSVLRYEEVPDPLIGPEEVLIRVKGHLRELSGHLGEARASGGELTPHLRCGCGRDYRGGRRAGSRGSSRASGSSSTPTSLAGGANTALAGEDSLCVHYKILGEQTDGGYAEFVKVPARNVIPPPRACPLRGGRGRDPGLHDRLAGAPPERSLRPGEDILILGAGGGVATAAIQIAKLVGARVFVTASSEEKLEGAKRLGADFLINYKEVEFDKEVRRLTNKRGVDVVVDSIGAETWLKSLRSLAKGGRLVTYGATSGPNPQTEIRLIFWKPAQGHRFDDGLD
jgi:NADPH:quinone reductase-like Zn-dependent oxidoreductase